MRTEQKAQELLVFWERQRDRIRQATGSDWLLLDQTLTEIIIQIKVGLDQIRVGGTSEIDVFVGKFLSIGLASEAKSLFLELKTRLSGNAPEPAQPDPPQSDETHERRSTNGGSTRRSTTRGMPRGTGRRSRGLRGMPSGTPDPTTSDTVRRTPHIDIDSEQPIPHSSIFTVSVYADEKAARDGEIAQEFELDVSRAIVDVSLITSSHFELQGNSSGALIIDKDESSTAKLQFEVRVKTEEELNQIVEDLPHASRGSIMAVFSYEGRPCGKVSRVVTIDWQQDRSDTPDSMDADSSDEDLGSAGTLQIETGAKPADMTVEVLIAEANDGRQFLCRVSSSIAGFDTEREWEQWNLPNVTNEIVKDHMETFVSEEIGRRQNLIGAGKNFFKSSPESFRKLYWELVDSGHPPKSLAVISAEPFIPWELMVPNRRKNGKNESRDALGVELAVGRWIPDDALSPPQKITLTDSLVVAPVYEGRDALKHAQDEAQFVKAKFPGSLIAPATSPVVDATLGSTKATILHLCCHGSDSTNTSQVILLKDIKLRSSSLSGYDGFQNFFNQSKALVFLNACEVGRPKLALVGVGGFAKAFIDLGASAVVAALWSVDDAVAHQIAIEFYTAVAEDANRPFADIFREIRSRAYQGEGETVDTYAAYCFYGDPLACAG